MQRNFQQMDIEASCMPLKMKISAQSNSVETESGPFSLSENHRENLTERLASNNDPPAADDASVAAFRPHMFQMGAITSLSWGIDYFQKFLWQDELANGRTIVGVKSNPQSQVVRFANEIEESMSKLSLVLKFSCAGENKQLRAQATLSKALEPLRDMIAAKRFDLFYQFPWVAGSQMVHLWMYAMSNGVLLCNQHGFVATVLCVYNAAVKTKTIKQIPTLDALCLLLKDTFLRKKLPTENFYSHYAACVGGHIQGRQEAETKIQQAKNDAKKTGDNPRQRIEAIKKNRFHMVLPEHMPCGDENCPVDAQYIYIKANDLSMSFEVAAENSFSISLSDRNQLLGGNGDPAMEKLRHDQAHRVGQALRELGQCSMVDEEELDLLRKLIRTDFNSDSLSACRLNWPLVLNLCVRVVMVLSIYEDGEGAGPLAGFESAILMLKGFERRAARQEASLELRAWPVAEATIKDMFRMSVADLMWKNLSVSSK